MELKNSSKLEISDLFFYLIKKWKIMVIASLVGALVFSVLFSFIDGKRDVRKKYGVTDSQIENVKMVSNMIDTFVKKKDNQIKYNDTSIYQNLDALSLDAIELDFYVNNDFEIEYPVIDKTNPISAIINSYISLLQSEDICEIMSQKIDSTIDPIYYAELIKYKYENNESGYFSVYIYGNNVNMMNKMADIVVDYIDSHKDIIVEKYGNNAITVINRQKVVIIDSEMSKLQQENIQRTNSLVSTISSLKASLSNEEMMYYNYLLSEGEQSRVISTKNIVIGALIGVTVAMIIYIFIYIFDRRLRNIYDIEKNWGISIISELNRESIDLASIRIETFLNKNGNTNICILSSNISDLDRILIDDVVKSMNENIKLTLINDANSDADSLKKFADFDAAILFEHINASKFSDIDKTVKLCEKYGTFIVGAVVVN